LEFAIQLPDSDKKTHCGPWCDIAYIDEFAWDFSFVGIKNVSYELFRAFIPYNSAFCG